MSRSLEIDLSGLVLTPAAMRAVDEATIAGGVDGFALMMRAGREVARVICRLFPPQRTIIVCGPGNNGGDGYVIAKRLADAGWTPEVVALQPDRSAKGDAAKARSLWEGAVARAIDARWGTAGLIVDAMFGTGFKGKIEGDAAAVVAAINHAPATILSVDIPSGVDGETGEIHGPAVKAEHCVTFCVAKPGLLLLPGKDLAGEVHTVHIGIAPETVARFDRGLRINEPRLWRHRLPRRGPYHHKYDFGHVLVRSGPPLATGAARLAASAALSVGAGLVSISCEQEAGRVCAEQLTEIMIKRADTLLDFKTLLADPRFNAILLGPGQGVGAETREMAEVVLEAKRCTVLDADALTSFAGAPDRLYDRAHEQVVLTPHEGEFSRLFDIKGDRLTRVREAARISGCVVLLKGSDTLIAAPDGRVAFSSAGSPFLATAGTGDVLAGAIVGLAAQGMSAFEAACAGAWFHAEASVRHEKPFVAGQLITHFSEIRSELSLA